MGDKKQTILVVDDEVINAKVLREFLKSDYTILVTTSGEDALEILESTESIPDLILLDIIMPGMNGYELCKKLKANQQTKFIPIIFITSKSTEKDEIKGFEVGAVDYITKPFSAPIVKARVKTHLELKALREHFEKLSLRDCLTGIANRMHFDQKLLQEWKIMQREKLPLSLILCDVDYFKKYNDHYGHQAGDSCLQRVAFIIHINAKRPADLASRFGGEEFAVILPNTDTQGALMTAENIRSEVQRYEIPHAESAVSPFVSISLGVATIIPIQPFSPEKLTALADAALYKAKRNGRNRVEKAMYDN
ncbi:MAG: diguanylate cyclase [Desulfamplus sp.]|nr:diguanylate cyclase [Desulfamplus sp.]